MTEATRESSFEGERLQGRMRFDCFARTRADGEALISASEGGLNIDMGGLAYANSLAVSAMIAWYRFAFHQGKIVRFSNVSPDLRKIIAISGLVDLLLDGEGNSDE